MPHPAAPRRVVLAPPCRLARSACLPHDSPRKRRQGKNGAAMTSRYHEAHRRSLEHPEAFWTEAAGAIEWEGRWDRVLDFDHPPFARWFTGGRLNVCHNALDRHVAEGRGAQTALIYDSPVTGTVQRW